jgi:hypothetical protein
VAKPNKQLNHENLTEYLNTLGLGDFSEIDPEELRPIPDAQARRIRRALPKRVMNSVRGITDEVEAIKTLANAIGVWLKEPEKKAEALTKKVLKRALRSSRNKTSRVRRT